MLNPKKLLHSKWIAVHPINKEKHFIVTKVMLPEAPMVNIEYVELEAVHSKRVQILCWEALKDVSVWKQGW